MARHPPVLGQVLDGLDAACGEDSVTVQAVVQAIGPGSFAALMLVFALVVVSPASVIPGVTATVGVLEVILAAQMIAGRRHLWLPAALARREVRRERLRAAVAWLRRPVGFVDRLLRPRLAFLSEKPWVYAWLVMVLGIGLAMPFMELLPGTGTAAASVIALAAAGIATRDGALLVVAGLGFAALVWALVWLGSLV